MFVLDKEVLGTTYHIQLGERNEIDLKEEFDGVCEIYKHNIKVLHSSEDDLTDLEKENRTQEVLAHELFHAYLNEAGIDLDDGVEEQLACFYMKNWRKLNNSILDVLDNLGIE